MEEIRGAQKSLGAAENALIKAQDEHAQAEESEVAAKVTVSDLFTDCMQSLHLLLTYANVDHNASTKVRRSDLP